LYSRYVEPVLPVHTATVGSSIEDLLIEAVVYILPRLVAAVILFLFAKVAIRLVHRMVAGFLRSRAVKMDNRRRETMSSLLDNITRYAVYFVLVLMLLSTLGVHIEAILAGAGIAGLAVGLAAQGLIKDVISGFFILFEDQFAVGDVVKINGVTGTVQSIGLRLTRLQAWTGEVEVIPNGLIGQITNYSKANSLAVIDVAVSPKADLDAALAAMQRALDEVRRTSPDVTGEAKVLGVQALRPSDVLLRATIECRPNTNAGVQRLAQYHIRQAFAADGIEWAAQ
jgi:small conductance mechanosensitive channel